MDIHGGVIWLMTHWVGPWLLAAFQVWLVAFSWWMVIDLEGWRADMASSGLSPKAIASYPITLLVYLIIGALVSFGLALGHGGQPADFLPRDFRGWIYAAYVPLDLAAGLALIIKHHNLLPEALTDYGSAALIWTVVFAVVGAVAGAVITYLVMEKPWKS